jgi:hypothetical protein
MYDVLIIIYICKMCCKKRILYIVMVNLGFFVKIGSRPLVKRLFQERQKQQQKCVQKIESNYHQLLRPRMNDLSLSFFMTSAQEVLHDQGDVLLKDECEVDCFLST